MEICKKIDVKIVNIGGIDFVDGKKKLMFGVIWQLMRKEMLKVLGNCKDEDLLEWAN